MEIAVWEPGLHGIKTKLIICLAPLLYRQRLPSESYLIHSGGVDYTVRDICFDDYSAGAEPV